MTTQENLDRMQLNMKFIESQMIILQYQARDVREEIIRLQSLEKAENEAKEKKDNPDGLHSV